MVRSAVAGTMIPLNSQELIAQTLKEYNGWIDAHSPMEAE
jgi:hypothetical protein